MQVFCLRLYKTKFTSLRQSWNDMKEWKMSWNFRVVMVEWQYVYSGAGIMVIMEAFILFKRYCGRMGLVLSSGLLPNKQNKHTEWRTSWHCKYSGLSSLKFGSWRKKCNRWYCNIIDHVMDVGTKQEYFTDCNTNKIIFSWWFDEHFRIITQVALCL